MISSMRTICIFVLLLITSSAPCDIFAASNTPCVAAHSTVRALYSTYTGPLYQLLRTIDNATMDIHPLGPGGVADAASHDAFCAGGGGSGGGSGNGLPPMGSVVALSPVGALAKFALRHCYSQAFVTPEADSGADHTFSLQPALNGAMGAISLRSVNYPDEWLAPVSGAEPGRLGIAPTSAFSPAEGSFAVSPAPGGVGITLASLAPAGGLIAVGSNLTGTCAHSYEPPAASVYLLSAPAPSAVTAWTISSTGPPGPASCQIWRVYDQSGRGNTLNVSGPAINNPADNNAVNATRHPLMLNGHKTYGMFFEGGMGYRALNTNGIALDNEPETLYMVTSGTHVNSGCCFDYGNAESQPNNASTFHDGTMEAINFSVTDVSDVWCGGNGTTGPWVMADLENGLWAGGCATGHNAQNTALTSPFVTAMVKGGTDSFAIKGGDATRGVLKVMYDGPRPAGYQPMKKQGAIILGMGGDNAYRGGRRSSRVSSVESSRNGEEKPAIPCLSIGTFYEGAMTAGYSTDDADAALQEDIIAAGFTSLSM